MLQMTLDRASEFVSTDHILVVLGREHLAVAREQLPQLGEEQFLIEPAGRDTAACIGFAAVTLRLRDPDSVMVVLPADHYVPDSSPFAETMSEAIRWAKKGDFLVTVGIQPTRPEIGYGYIHAGERTGGPHEHCYRVNRFVEKPDEATASLYLSEGDYYWNAGIFVWQVKVILKAIERHMADLWMGLTKMEEASMVGDLGLAEDLFKGLPRISIDYGLMEKADNVLVIKAGFRWDDVGTWSSLKRTMKLDEKGNYVSGQPLCIDTRDCVIYSEDVRMGVVGVSNLVVVASREGVLVCSLLKDQETRKIARFFEIDEVG
jgi:mannose-1-phosphate guanylyltransferase